ncbi:hypothetical protein GCM10010381_68560 [Streptomyces xantholiticus]|nr:hypothetical protein GCM10010381_68560 [Streptomyces xantholiticus]
MASTEAAREAGAVRLAATNDPDWLPAAVFEYHIDVMARSEKALPVTKTYTASLMALHLLVEGLRGGEEAAAGMLPELAAQMLGRQDEVRARAARHRFAERVVITSRGYGCPTAGEATLELMETSRLPVLAYSGADLPHGPPAMVDNVSPVIAVSRTARAARRSSRCSTGCGAAARTCSWSARPLSPRGRPRASCCPRTVRPRISSRSWRSFRSGCRRTR